MSDVNVTVFTGRLVKEPEFLTTAAKKRFAKVQVETAKYLVVNGQSKRFASVIPVVCYNQFSLNALEHAKAGARVKVQGEITSRNGIVEVTVAQYSGEVGLMEDSAPDRSLDGNSPAPARERSSSLPQGNGGLGRLARGRNVEDEDPREAEPARPASAPARSDLDLDDDIPF